MKYTKNISGISMKIKITALLLAIATVVVLVNLSSISNKTMTVDTTDLNELNTGFSQPISVPADLPENHGAELDRSDSFFNIAVPVTVEEKQAFYVTSPDSKHDEITHFEAPKTKNMKAVKSLPVSEAAGYNEDEPKDFENQTKSTQSTIEAVDFNDNAVLTGFFNIPADSHAAAGPNHVLNVVNTSIQIFQKDGTLDFQDSLSDFFSSVSPANGTFDPKVIYDQFLDRWVVITLERVDAPENSRVLVAVSDDSDPNGTWFQGSVNTLLNINGVNNWLDYPGLAVDDEAIYITGNMFSFPGVFGGNRVLIIDKGFNAGGLYDGGATAANIYDPAGQFSSTHQPAHIFGSTPGNVGTWLVMYSGLSGGGNEALQTIRIDNPLGTPTFTTQVFFVGDFDDTASALVGSPQSGTATNIDAGDRRTLSAVWRNNSLYLTTEAISPSGVDAGQASVIWAEINTSNINSLSLNQLGHIGGEDIGASTYTSYGSLAVNDDGGIAIGFSASSSTIFPSSYYVTRSPSDPAGTVRSSKLIRSGLANYVRTFSGTRNRWGDYSGAALDPDGECFWIYNKYAKTQGNANGGNGRWATAYAHECNDQPNGVNDLIEVDENATATTVNGASTSVLDNDSDTDADDTLMAVLVSAPADASAFNLNANGTFSYAHNGDEDPTDSFTYNACDDGTPAKCNLTTVNITINNVNDDPNAVNDTATTDEDVMVSVAVLTGDSDVDAGDTLSVTSCTGASNGSVVLNGNNCEFTPALNFNGQGSFNYAISDGNSGTDTASVTVTVDAVNDDPTAVNDTATTDEDVMVSVAVLTGDSDVDTGDTLSVTSCTGASNGSVVLNGNNCEFTPTLNFSGQGSFNYAISDGNNGSDSASVTVTVDAVNDDPTAVNDTATTDEDVMVSVAVLTGDSDVDAGDTLSVTSCTGASNGSVVLNGNNCEFTPALNFNGQGSFDYAINDGNGGTDTASVTVTVDPVNDDPVAMDDERTINEEIPVIVDVLANDSDPDAGDLLSATIELGDAEATGRVTLNSDDTFTYDPNGQFESLSFGTSTVDVFTYTVSDSNGGVDQATVTITIDGVNDEPMATNDITSTNEDTMVAVAVLTGDTDVDTSDTLSVTSCSNASNGTVVRNGNNCEFTPALNFNGQGSFNYAISDGNGGTDTASVTVTVDAVSDDPTAVNDVATTDEDVMVSVAVLAGDFDPDQGDVLSVTSCTGASNGSVIRNGNNCEFTPTLNFNGQGSFNYAISDGNNGSDSASVTVTVDAVNDDPTAVNDTVITDEDVMVSVAVLTGDSDVDTGDVLSVTSCTGASNGSVVLNGNNCEFTPTLNFSGQGSFNYAISDGNNGSDSASVTVTVDAVNDDPTAVNDTATTDEDVMVSVAVLTGDSDVDTGDVLSVTSCSGATNGSVILNGNNCEFTPVADFNGQGSFNYAISDGNNGSDSASVTVTVDAINDEPSMAVNPMIYVSLSDIANPPAQNLACQFDFGPDDEDASQAISDMNVSIINDVNGVINTIDVDNMGALNYTFTGNSGMAEVTVSLQDDGGTANSGDDTSVDYIFVVNVQDYVFRSGFESAVCP